MLNTHKHTKTKAIRVTNIATVEKDEIPLVSAKATFLVAKSADLAVFKITTKHIGYVWESLIYVIKVVNKGPSKATGIILTDILPYNCICSSIYLTQGIYKKLKNKITCYLGELNCDANALAIIIVVPKRPCIVTNRAFVTANEYDKNYNNNFFATNTKIYCRHPIIQHAFPFF